MSDRDDDGLNSPEGEGVSYEGQRRMCEHLESFSVPSAYNTSAGSAEPLTSSPNERMKGGLQGDPGSWISRPESEKWETPNRKEPGNWEKIPSRTAGFMKL